MMRGRRTGRAFNGGAAGLLYRLRDQLWFVPGITAVAAFVLARVLVEVDGRIEREKAWFLFQGTSASARELVSTIASATMTFTGLVFSITILVLQLASQQFSPRVLKEFLEDRHTKVSMAVFVGTFVFAMSLLLSIRDASDEVERLVPTLSVFVAFLLALASVGVFIHYIHHIAHAIRAVTVIRRIADETHAAVDDMFPSEGEDVDDVPVDLGDESAPPGVVCWNGRAGSLTHVDEERLFMLAEKHDGLIEVVPLVGDYVLSNVPVIHFWPADRAELARAIDALVIEPERRSQQDPLFGLRQLVDIAERALSPGINDPSTAVQVLDEIHDILRRLATCSYPSPVRANRGGIVRLVLPRPTWREAVQLAIAEIRQFGRRSSQVIGRLRTLLDDLIEIAPPERIAPLAEQRALLQTALAHDDAPAVWDHTVPRRRSVTTRRRNDLTK